MQTQQEKLRYDTTWWRGNYCTQNNNVQNTFLFKKKMVICECEKYAPDSPTFHIGSMLRARWWWGGGSKLPTGLANSLLLLQSYSNEVTQRTDPSCTG